MARLDRLLSCVSEFLPKTERFNGGCNANIFVVLCWSGCCAVDDDVQLRLLAFFDPSSSAAGIRTFLERRLQCRERIFTRFHEMGHGDRRRGLG